MLSSTSHKAIERQHLSDLGFDFRYFTERAESETSELTYFRFDIGYVIQENEIRFVLHPKYQKVLKAI